MLTLAQAMPLVSRMAAATAIAGHLRAGWLAPGSDAARAFWLPAAYVSGAVLVCSVSQGSSTFWDTATIAASCCWLPGCLDIVEVQCGCPAEACVCNKTASLSCQSYIPVTAPCMMGMRSLHRYCWAWSPVLQRRRLRQLCWRLLRPLELLMLQQAACKHAWRCQPSYCRCGHACSVYSQSAKSAIQPQFLLRCSHARLAGCNNFAVSPRRLHSADQSGGHRKCNMLVVGSAALCVAVARRRTC